MLKRYQSLSKFSTRQIRDFFFFFFFFFFFEKSGFDSSCKLSLEMQAFLGRKKRINNFKISSTDCLPSMLRVKNCHMKSALDKAEFQLSSGSSLFTIFLTCYTIFFKVFDDPNILLTKSMSKWMRMLDGSLLWKVFNSENILPRKLTRSS